MLASKLFTQNYFYFLVCSRNDPARLCFICAYVTLILCLSMPANVARGGLLVHSGEKFRPFTSVIALV